MNKRSIIIINILIITIGILFTSVLSYSQDTLRLGITRFVNPSQYFTHRHIGLELQKYLVYNLKKTENIKPLHKRVTDRILLNASVDDLNNIYSGDIVRKSNKAIRAHLLLMGYYNVIDGKEVVFTFSIVKPKTADKVRTYNVKGDVENLIPLFNQVLRKAVQGSNRIYKGYEVSINEKLDKVLINNENLSLFSYNMFVDVEKQMAEEDYISAITNLNIMIYDNRDLKRIYYYLATCYEKLEDWDKAFISHLKLFEQFSKDMTKEQLLNIYWKLGKNYLLAKKSVEARPYLEKALSYANELKLQWEQAEIIYDRAISYYMNNETDESFKLLKEALDLNLKINNKIGLLNTYLQIAKMAFFDRDYPKVLENAQNALSIAEKIDHTFYICKAKSYIIDIRIIENKKDEAKKLALENLEMADKTGNKFLIADAYYDLGQLFEHAVVYKSAMKSYKKAFEISKSLMEIDLMEKAAFKIGVVKNELCKGAAPVTQLLVDNHIRLSKIFEKYTKDYANYRNISMLLDMRSEYKLASKYMDKAKEVSKKVESIRLEVKDYSDLADLYLKLKEYDKAFVYYTNSLELAEKIEDAPIITKQYLNIGRIFKYKNNIDNAIESVVQALDIASIIKDPLLLIEIHTELADLYLIQRQMDKYNENMEKAIKIAEKVGSPKAIKLKNRLQKETTS